MDGIETHRTGGKTLRIVRDRDTFSRFRKRWDGALEDYRHKSIHLSHQWLDAMWESHEDEIDGRVMMVDDANGPCALAPLMLHKYRYRGLSIPALSPLDYFRSARSDVPLLRDEEDCIDILRNFTRRCGGRLWHLDRFPAHSTLVQMIGNDESARRIDHYESPTLAFVDTTISWHEFLHDKSQNFRNDCKRLQDDLDGTEMEIIREHGPDAEPLMSALRAAAPLDPRREKFLRRMIAEASTAGTLYAVLARKNGKPAGHAIGIAYDGVLYAIDLSCDRDNGNAPAGLGTLAELLWLCFEDRAIRRCDLDTIDDGETWKRRWATGFDTQVSALILNGGVGSAAIRAGRTLGGLKRALVPGRKPENDPMDEVA